MSTPSSSSPSPLGDPITVVLFGAVLAGTVVVGASLLQSEALSIPAFVGGFLLGWAVMYVDRLEVLGTVGGRLKDRGAVVTLGAVAVLVIAVYALLSTLSLESWLLTNTSFGLLLGVFAVLLAGP